MNYPAAELRGIKINFYLINPDAKHRGILLIKIISVAKSLPTILNSKKLISGIRIINRSKNLSFIALGMLKGDRYPCGEIICSV